MKALLLACTLLAACPARADVPDLPGPGSISYQWPGTQTFLDLSWSWKVAGGGSWRSEALSCDNLCEGPKIGHVTHSVCDLSCDLPCPGGHRLTAEPRLVSQTGRALMSDFRKFGIPNPEGFAAGVDADVQALARGDLLTNPAYQQHFRLDCTNTTPCSYLGRHVQYRTYELTIASSLYRTTTLPDGSSLRTQGPKTTYTAEYDIYLPDLLSDRAPRVICRCEINIQPEEHSNAFLPGGDPVQDDQEFASIERDGKQEPLTTGDFNNLEFAIDAQDMNTATIACTSWPEGVSRLFIPAGWGLQNLDGEGQSTLLSTNANFQFVEPRPFGPFSNGPTATVRTLCLQIDRPEPRSGMKYRLVPPANPALTRLARMARSARGGGPADQTRLWIVTDHASLDKIAETLFPPPTPATYLHEARRAWEQGALGVQEEAVRKILPRELLLTPGMSASDVVWLVEQKLLVEGTETGAWMRGQTDLVEKAFEHRNGPAQIAALANSFLERGDWRTALWLVAEGTPPNQRKTVAETPAGYGVGLLLARTPAAKDAYQKWVDAVQPAWAAFANDKRP
ncbi:MAG: hypothetical protein M9921_11305 [Fimbriimonadaceae bacterium]|nr:hypothetical protein [Fimbriimonadaceae bacterium]